MREPIYAYTPRHRPQIGSRRPSGQCHAAQTPPHDLPHPASSIKTNQNRIFSAASTGDNRHRTSSTSTNFNKVQSTYATSRYDAATEIGRTTAAADSKQRQYTGGVWKRPPIEIAIIEGRSLYIKGYSFQDFHSDLVPNMMASCGEIETYKPHMINPIAFIK
jgi:hypothetical protein